MSRHVEMRDGREDQDGTRWLIQDLVGLSPVVKGASGDSSACRPSSTGFDPSHPGIEPGGSDTPNFAGDRAIALTSGLP